MPVSPLDTTNDSGAASAAGLLPGSPDLRRLASPKSGTWFDFRRSLSPNYALAWFELAFSIVLMTAGFAGHLALVIRYGDLVGLETGVLFTTWIGFWLNSVLTFGHEAAHYNMSSDKNRNDALSDWTIWLFFPQSTKSYRRSHWQHHLHLGDHEDTEISYQNCLSPWFLAKAVSGIYLVSIIVRYFFRKRTSVQWQPAETAQSIGFVPILRAVATHSVFISIALWIHAYSTAVIWLVAVIFVFPFFTSVRQILEHRSATSGCEIDFTKKLHGPVNRLFGMDPFSRFFGAAGFNRHLLHHWDPTVSYTCFDQMQSFLKETELKPRLESATSTYFSTFVMLVKEAVRGNG